MPAARTEPSAARRGRVARLAGLYAVTPDSGDDFLVRMMIDPLGSTFDGTFTFTEQQVGNYTTMVMSGTGFTLAVHPQIGFQTHAPLNGIQIVRGDRIFYGDFDHTP